MQRSSCIADTGAGQFLLTCRPPWTNLQSPYGPSEIHLGLQEAGTGRIFLVSCIQECMK